MYDLIVVGSGFASVFFLKNALDSGRVNRALVLERGRAYDWEWQVRNKRNCAPEDNCEQLIERSGMDGKRWVFNVGLGGGSNCWWANPMRFHPHDFDLKSRYGIATDWPIGYDDLEPYYCDAEDLIMVSGDSDSAKMFPRSRPFPQPRHRFSRVARLFKDRFPDTYFQMPQARARTATEIHNPCCSNSVCGTCPVNAKFMIINDLQHVLSDPRVDIKTDFEVQHIETTGADVTGVSGRTRTGETIRYDAETVALGANAIFNPFLLLKSGIDHGPVGKGLNEQATVNVTLYLDGLEDGDGSAHVTGVGYNEIHGEFRATASGGFFETQNLPLLRPEKGKWRCMVDIVFLLEDLRQDQNYVAVSKSDPAKPMVHFEGWSPYVVDGIERIKSRIPDLVSHLPIEYFTVDFPKRENHAHILGTTVMGTDASSSVVDANLVHHKYRNLLVLGSGVFPTSSWANPTLTLSALSLRAANAYYLGAT